MDELEAQTSLVVKLRAKRALMVDLKFRKFINFLSDQLKLTMASETN